MVAALHNLINENFRKKNFANFNYVEVCRPLILNIINIIKN